MKVNIKEDKQATVSFAFFYNRTLCGPHIFRYEGITFLYTAAERYCCRLCVNLDSGVLVAFRGDEQVVPLRGHFECEVDTDILKEHSKNSSPLVLTGSL